MSPDRGGPGGVAASPCHDMQMQLWHQIAYGRYVDLVRREAGLHPFAKLRGEIKQSATHDIGEIMKFFRAFMFRHQQ